MSLQEIKAELKEIASEEYAKTSARFFKTSHGDYGEGDIFIGVRVPALRKIAKSYKELALTDIKKLLQSAIHEERMLAVIILVNTYRKSPQNSTQLFEFYIENFASINNWDLVDLSAPNISGQYLLQRDKSILYQWVKSDNLWIRRISIISTFTFIRNGEYSDTIKLSKILLEDSHDLIHKAVGWMLREVGKRDFQVTDQFLEKYYQKMPRTMLRYALEHYPAEHRKKYLKGLI